MNKRKMNKGNEELADGDEGVRRRLRVMKEIEGIW